MKKRIYKEFEKHIFEIKPHNIKSIQFIFPIKIEIDGQEIKGFVNATFNAEDKK